MHEHKDDFQQETEGEQPVPSGQYNLGYLAPIVTTTPDAMIAIDEHFCVRDFNTATSTKPRHGWFT